MRMGRPCVAVDEGRHTGLPLRHDSSAATPRHGHVDSVTGE